MNIPQSPWNKPDKSRNSQGPDSCQNSGQKGKITPVKIADQIQNTNLNIQLNPLETLEADNVKSSTSPSQFQPGL